MLLLPRPLNSLVRFSPLFIGAHASTSSQFSFPASKAAVSVPSSSGHMLQRCGGVWRGGVWCEFQSPLHRGTCFNQSLTGARDTSYAVSVPSSSGHMLQPESVTGTARSPVWFQSPLHRGTCFNGSMYLDGHLYDQKFQSPLHRGTCFNVRDDFSVTCPHMFQSPLHRGTCFNASNQKMLRNPLSWFQSPLHRGTCFNKDAAKETSVADQGFSPLFIGAHASTQDRSDLVTSKVRVSVPSSSGHMLQPLP